MDPLFTNEILYLPYIRTFGPYDTAEKLTLIANDCEAGEIQYNKAVHSVILAKFRMSTSGYWALKRRLQDVRTLRSIYWSLFPPCWSKSGNGGTIDNQYARAYAAIGLLLRTADPNAVMMRLEELLRTEREVALHVLRTAQGAYDATAAMQENLGTVEVPSTCITTMQMKSSNSDAKDEWDDFAAGSEHGPQGDEALVGQVPADSDISSAWDAIVDPDKDKSPALIASIFPEHIYAAQPSGQHESRDEVHPPISTFPEEPDAVELGGSDVVEIGEVSTGEFGGEAVGNGHIHVAQDDPNTASEETAIPDQQQIKESNEEAQVEEDNEPEFDGIMEYGIEW